MKNLNESSVTSSTSAGNRSSAVAETVADTEQRPSTPDHILLARRVKGTLITDAACDYKGIAVEAFENAVQLTGRVGTRAEAGRAVELAASVAGVDSVRDCLQIEPCAR